MLHEYSYNGCGLPTFGKVAGFLGDARFQRAHARGWNSGHKKVRHIDDNRWIVHTALWAATRAARLPGDFVECGVDTGMFSLAVSISTNSTKIFGCLTHLMAFRSSK